MLGRSLKQLILPEILHVEIRTVWRTCVNHLEPGFTLQNSTFFPQSVFIFFVLIAEPTVITGIFLPLRYLRDFYKRDKLF
jgi:hypothetical protein